MPVVKMIQIYETRQKFARILSLLLSSAAHTIKGARGNEISGARYKKPTLTC
jgi:hypothetical protein